jgi:large subunit ribosomal protein L4
MNIPLYSSAGQKKGTIDLPATLFAEAPNRALIHQAVVLQQSNRRVAVAHAKTRGEIVGSTKKLYQQKGTGRARRGPIRSPILRGGGKTFGPRNNRNFRKDMPRAMRHAALRSCLGLQAKREAVLALDQYPDTVKTKDFAALLKKLPVDFGRHILVVTADAHRGVMLSSRNVPGVKAVTAAYLNPEDVVRSRHVIFLQDALKKAEEMFGKKATIKEKAPKKAAPKKSL